MRVFEGIKISNGYGQRMIESVYQIPNEWIDQISKEMRRTFQAETKNLQTPWDRSCLSEGFYVRVQQ
jgi:hypothetical protein